MTDAEIREFFDLYRAAWFAGSGSPERRKCVERLRRLRASGRSRVVVQLLLNSALSETMAAVPYAQNWRDGSITR